MKKRVWISICVMIFSVFLVGCSRNFPFSKKNSGHAATITLDGDHFAFVFPGSETPFYKSVVNGIDEIMTKAGRTYEVFMNDSNDAVGQRQIVKKLIDEKYSCIAVDPLGYDFMADILSKALESDIDICSFDKPLSKDSSEMHISLYDPDAAAQQLMDVIFEVCGGEGEWAILSESYNRDALKNLSSALRSISGQDTYVSLTCVSETYSDRMYRRAYDQVRSLVQNNPDLKVICVLSPNDMKAACDAVSENGLNIKITGFAEPDEIKNYIGVDRICPCVFILPSVDLGRLTAYISIALSGNVITLQEDEDFIAEGMGRFTILKSENGGLETIVGLPVKYPDDDNE